MFDWFKKKSKSSDLTLSPNEREKLLDQNFERVERQICQYLIASLDYAQLQPPEAREVILEYSQAMSETIQKLRECCKATGKKQVKLFSELQGYFIKFDAMKKRLDAVMPMLVPSDVFFAEADKTSQILEDSLREMQRI